MIRIAWGAEKYYYFDIVIVDSYSYVAIQCMLNSLINSIVINVTMNNSDLIENGSYMCFEVMF